MELDGRSREIVRAAMLSERSVRFLVFDSDDSLFKQRCSAAVFVVFVNVCGAKNVKKSLMHTKQK